VTTVVMSWVEPSVYVPVAVSCFPVPNGREVEAGVMPRPVNSAGPTVILAAADIAPIAALMVAPPCDTELTRPDELTVAIVVVADDHVTDAVRLVLVPSL
jgi:hypothetical protein